MRLVLIIWPLAIAVAQHNGQPAAATVNGQPITLTQLDAEIKPQLARLEEQIRKLRQSILAKLIDNLLLDQAAKTEGISLDEYMRRHVERIAVADAEVEETYLRTRDRYPGALPTEAKYRIRRSLEDNRRAEALRLLLERLRRTAVVRNYLLEGKATGIDLTEGDPPVLGPPSAPVTIVAFSDFQCPFSRDANLRLRKLVEKSTGAIRLVFRHFPLPSHRWALDAARAGVCAHRQGKFWPFHDRLFESQRDLSPPGLTALVEASDIDPDQFTACMKDATTADRVRRDIEIARAAGVDGTPALFVNGDRLAGPEELPGRSDERLRPRVPVMRPSHYLRCVRRPVQWPVCPSANVS